MFYYSPLLPLCSFLTLCSAGHDARTASRRSIAQLSRTEMGTFSGAYLPSIELPKSHVLALRLPYGPDVPGPDHQTQPEPTGNASIRPVGPEPSSPYPTLPNAATIRSKLLNYECSKQSLIMSPPSHINPTASLASPTTRHLASS